MADWTATSEDHLLIESTVSVGQTCHVCGRPMLGLVRQGYFCHSMLSAVLVPTCCVMNYSS